MKQEAVSDEGRETKVQINKEDKTSYLVKTRVSFQR